MVPSDDPQPAIAAKVPRIWFCRFWSTAEPMRGPATLVDALKPANCWMSDRTVLQPVVTMLWTAVDMAVASGATVTVTGLVVGTRPR